MFLNEAVGTGFLGCEGVLGHDLFFFFWQDKHDGRYPGSVTIPQRLPQSVSWHDDFQVPNASCLDDLKKKNKKKKQDFHRNEQKRETTLRNIYQRTRTKAFLGFQYLQ